MRKRINGMLLLTVCVCIIVLTGCGKRVNKEQENYRQYGINCMQSGDYEGAVEAFQNALNQSEGKIGAMELDICYYKAEAQYLAGKSDDALETYNALIAYNKDAQAYYLRGSLYFAQGRQQEALDDYAMAVNQSPDDYKLYIGIYETMKENGLEMDGQYYLNQALEIEGKKAEDLMQKGRIYFLLSDTQNATKYLQEAIDKGNVEANFYLGETYELLGDKSAADKCYQAYLDAGLADSYDLCQMGERQMKNEDYTHAIIYFTSALTLPEVPNKQQIMKNMIVTYEKEGDFKTAKSVLKDYLQLYPSDEDAQREKVFLSTR